MIEVSSEQNATPLGRYATKIGIFVSFVVTPIGAMTDDTVLALSLSYKCRNIKNPCNGTVVCDSRDTKVVMPSHNVLVAFSSDTAYVDILD